jgi:hypothetical protein
MNDFQARCWERCHDILQREGISYIGPTQIDGKRESYYLVQLEREDTTIELYIYVNEAGTMLNRKQWRIFEAPDFADEKQLIDAFVGHVQQLVSVARMPDRE